MCPSSCVRAISESRVTLDGTTVFTIDVRSVVETYNGNE